MSSSITKRSRKRVTELLGLAGVTVNGKEPWDIVVHDERFYSRALSQGSLGLGESYIEGWWDCAAIDEMITRVLRADLHSRLTPSMDLVWDALRAWVSNRQNKSAAFKNGQAHYDIGNDLYRAMLDERFTYTCGYFKDTQNLNEAQEAKLDLVCRKIGLKAGDRVLDIGCGWGSFAKYAAEKYGAHVVGITVAKEQVALGTELCKGLPVELRLQDYRDVNEPFDHIVSLGMFEHVGDKNHRSYFEVARRCLKDGGLFLLHTIGGNKSAHRIDPWINRYIFPGAVIPSAQQVTKASEGLFVMEDWHNFGAYYDQTLMSWCRNFESAWEKLAHHYDERFHRMWRYYLLACAATFRARENHLWQIVFSKNGVPGGYSSVR